MNACANVLASFGVMGGGGVQSMGPEAPALLIKTMKRLEAEDVLSAERIPADLVQGEESGVNVKSGVLKTLGHDRAGEHLPAQHELQPFARPGAVHRIRLAPEKSPE